MRLIVRSLHFPEYRSFVSVLVEARHRAGVTQSELAKRIGKPQSFVSKVERCERRLDVPEYIVFVRALGRDPANVLKHVERVITASRTRH